MRRRVLALLPLLLTACPKKAADPVDAGPLAPAEPPLRRTDPAPCPDIAACEAACDQGQARACAEAARLLFEDNTKPRDLPHITSRYAKACQLNDGVSCDRAAGMTRAEDERPALREKATQLLPGQCERGDSEACELLHAAAVADAAPPADGGGPISPPSDRALALLRGQCADGSGPACHRLGSALLTGRLGARSPRDAEKLLDRACAVDIAGACAELGMAYNFGKLLPLDAVKAKHYMRRAGALTRQGAPAVDAGAP